MSSNGPSRWRGWWGLAAVFVLVLLVKLLLDHSSTGDARDPTGSGLSGRDTGRAPFPKEGEFPGVPRPGKIEPRPPSAPDPWEDGRQRK